MRVSSNARKYGTRRSSTVFRYGPPRPAVTLPRVTMDLIHAKNMARAKHGQIIAVNK